MNGDPRIAYQYVRPEQINSGMVQKDRNPAEQQQPVRQQSGEQDDGMPVVEKMQPEPDRGFGIASLVLGIISLVFFFATLNIPACGPCDCARRGTARKETAEGNGNCRNHHRGSRYLFHDPYVASDFPVSLGKRICTE